MSSPLFKTTGFKTARILKPRGTKTVGSQKKTGPTFIEKTRPGNDALDGFFYFGSSNFSW
jgi:hypothetical protein